MTRQEEIRQAAEAYKSNMLDFYVQCGKIIDPTKELDIPVEIIMDADCQAETFCEGAEWADEHPCWISVNDKLPQVNGKYLICEKRGFVDRAWFDKEYNCWMMQKAFLSPTHWMPLPEPPKKRN